MLRVCGWCKKEMGEAPGDGVTHGICSACKFHMRASMGIDLHEYLEGMPQPLFVVKDARIQGANAAAREMLQKGHDQILGELGGSVFECEYSYLPGGCGATEHCPGCTIRNTVMECVQTRKTKTTEVWLQQKSQKLKFLVSTESDGTCVWMKIEKAEPV